MTTLYEVRVQSPDGATRLAIITNFIEPDSGAGLDYVLSAGKIGVLQLKLPTTFDVTLIPLDARLSVWRSINGLSPVCDGNAAFLARMFEYTSDATFITAFHANEIFARRIVAYGTYQTQAVKAVAAADDMIKAFIDENLLSGTGSGFRYGNPTQADISTYLTRAANQSLGVSAAKAAAWRALHDTIIEVAEASTFSGTYIAAEIVAPTEGTLEARTYAGQRGVDHRASSVAPVIFSEARGNLKNAVLTVDHSQEVTFALAGGAGDGANRLTASAIDSTRIAASPLNRREIFVDVGNLTDTTQLQAEANAAVRAGIPRRQLAGDLVETPGCTRGIHFDYGDLVTIEHRGFNIDMRLDLIHEVVSSNERKSEIKFKALI